MRCIFALMVVLSLAACSGGKRYQHAEAPVADKAAAVKQNRTMAYEHSLDLVVEEAKLLPAYQSALAACKAASVEQCVVLASNVRSGDYAAASIKFRAQPAGIQALMAVLAGKGEIVNQSTTGEDLAAPLQDAAKQQEMLQNYRGKLEQLSARPGGDLESLIKITRELAEVQSNIEALGGKRAYMTQRVETEILNVELGTGHQSAFWKPVSAALSGASGNLSEGVATVISATSFLLPWALLLWFLLWGGRKLWRRARRKEQVAVEKKI